MIARRMLSPGSVAMCAQAETGLGVVPGGIPDARLLDRGHTDEVPPERRAKVIDL